ncbi:hypothetical protein QQF64_012842 [Cirrhinus molitorella]|uniref:Uncharacterized protein n=1 Tax=Cirrhinus molitorella TaxID=172907 RepID=A0ABR3LWN1_9TELE
MFLSQIIQTIGSIGSIESIDQIETLVMLLPLRRRRRLCLCASLASVTSHPRGGSAHELRVVSGGFQAPARFTRRFRPFVRLFSFDRRKTHPIGLSFCSLSLSHWERAGALIPLPINRLKSGPDAPRNARSGIYDIKRAVR